MNIPLQVKSHLPTNLIEWHHTTLPPAGGGTAVRAGDGPGRAAPLMGAQLVPRGLKPASVPRMAAREGEVATLNQALSDQVPHTLGDCSA